MAEGARPRGSDERERLHRRARLHGNGTSVARRAPRVSQGDGSGDRRSDAPLQCRCAGRGSRHAGELGRVRVVDARLVAGADRDQKSVRRVEREAEVTVRLKPDTTGVTFADVESAAKQIAGVAHKTPVATSRTINRHTGAELFFKCENLQRAGAFKFRGAYNALSRLDADERRRGVVTFSSGNHAQAIALAGQLLDIPRVIVMPSDAPPVKRIATEGYGGEGVLYDRGKEDREANRE